jgi:exopolyphosphatase/guanosine-5'-triphosphate,3'-diphosphate pyrophosphatase
VSRVAAVDIGSNSTRLLIAEGDAELARASIVTRLGEGVDTTGQLSDAAQRRVLDVLARFRAEIEAHGCEHAAAVMTSAVRDATNGPAFSTRVGAALGFAPRILSGEEEARLTYDGATRGRAGDFLVIDIGGGSTELVLGGTDFHVSTQIGVVRHSERHLHSDPPTAQELQALTRDVHEALMAHVPVRWREQRVKAIAVAGTPTQCAAIDLGLDPYDPTRIEGHVLTVSRLRELLAETADLPLAQRRKIRGLDPERASVIVAGIAILLEVVDCFSLDQVEASEHDILWGLARSTTPGP